MKRLSQRVAALLILALALAPACFCEIPDVFQLMATVAREYPGASVNVSINNGVRVVTVSFAGEASPVAGLDLEDAEAKAREIGGFLMSHYDSGADVDELRILFVNVEEREDGGRFEQNVEFVFDRADIATLPRSDSRAAPTSRGEDAGATDSAAASPS